MSIIHGLPFDEYQRRPGVNKTLLDHFAESPAKAKWYLSQPPERPTEAMKIGSLVDIAVFEPRKFDDCYYLRPESYEGEDDKGKSKVKPWNGNATACWDWMAAHRDRPVVTAAELVQINHCADAIVADPKAKLLMGAGTKTQVSLFATHELTRLPLKGRPDIVGDGFLADLKVSADSSTAWISRQIANMRWHLQAAFYLDLAKLCGMNAKDFYFLFVSSTEPHLVNVRRLEPSAIELGRQIYSRELGEFARCKATDSWPGPSGEGDEIATVDVPAWEYNKESADDDVPLVLTFGGKQHAL